MNLAVACSQGASCMIRAVLRPVGAGAVGILLDFMRAQLTPSVSAANQCLTTSCTLLFCLQLVGSRDMQEVCRSILLLLLLQITVLAYSMTIYWSSVSLYSAKTCLSSPWGRRNSYNWGELHHKRKFRQLGGCVAEWQKHLKDVIFRTKAHAFPFDLPFKVFRPQHRFW